MTTADAFRCALGRLAPYFCLELAVSSLPLLRRFAEMHAFMVPGSLFVNVDGHDVGRFMHIPGGVTGTGGDVFVCCDAKTAQNMNILTIFKKNSKYHSKYQKKSSKMQL